jgi:hypothetical protein
VCRHRLRKLFRVEKEAAYFLLVVGFLSALRMAAIHSSEIVMNFYWTRWYVPGDSSLHSHCCESLRPNKFTIVLHLLVFHTFLNVFFM